MLASGSPQRRALLARLGVPFTVRPTDAAEIEQGADPAQVALHNALRKALAAHRPGAHEAVLGCDTIVVLDGVIYGKPADPADARRTLSALGGRTHEVVSGLALLLPREGEPPAGEPGAGEPSPAGAEPSPLEQRTAIARTRVTFRALDEQLLDWYVATGEWRERSGGYAIQGAGARLAVRIDGEEENVVGLPLRALLEIYPELRPQV